MAAYFEITSIQTDRVILRVQPTYAEEKVQVKLYLATDISTPISEPVFDAKKDETYVTITGLEEGAKYVIEVSPNVLSGLWLAKQSFTAKRSGAVDGTGQLIKTPVLPTNYSLFSWLNWPQSRDALSQGGVVSGFEKDCWNAIVDKLYHTIMDAGLVWKHPETPPDLLKIHSYGGELRASAMNAFLDEIFCLARFPFVWEGDRTFRGYTGRRHFKGVAEHGINADILYPEYILEVVRRINLLIQIMRGWGPELEQIAFSNILTSTEVNRKIEWGLAAPFAKEEAVSVDYIEPPGRGGISGVLETDPQGMAAEYSAKMDKGKRRPFSGTEGTITRTKSVNIPQSKGVAATPGAASGKTDYTGDKFSSIKVSPLPQTVGQAASRVRSLRILSGIPRWVVFNADTIASDGTAAPDSGYAMLTYPRGFAGVSEAAEIAGAPEGRACGRGYSATRPATSFWLKKNVPVAVVEKSASKATAAIGTAWLPPVWIDGGLWIRQSHSVTQNENGELVIT